MKKFVTILLCVAISVPAFAAENTTLTINGATDRTYKGYKILNLTTSLKGDAHHVAHTGDHTNDCYNFAYTVNDPYREILKNEVFNNGGNYLWDKKPDDASAITDEQILKYLANQTSDNGDVYLTMRQVADRLYRAILNAGITAEESALTGNNDVIDQGYWLFADVTDLDGNEANSLVMVDTKGQENLVINAKIALPTVEKKVKDIEDSEDDSILDNAWHDSADHDIGDTVPFKLTATLPSNVQIYTSYTLIYHDTLSAGLTLDDTSVKVYMYETKHKADVDTDLNDGVDVTANFTVNVASATNFTVGCDNIYAIPGVTKDTAFVVYYEATLNESAVIGGAGNPNKVYLEFSNDPYGDGTGNTEIDEVVVFTYEIVVNKTDSHGHELEGAGFTLYKKNIDGSYTAIGTELTGTDMTTFTWTGLDDGDYKLVETTVPQGYNAMSDLLFSVSAEHDVTGIISIDGGLMGMGDTATGIIEKNIINNTGTVLPETGAEGTMFLICGGAMLVILAAVFMITRKKMSIYED